MHNTSDPAQLQILYSQFSALDMEKTRYMKRAESLCQRPKNTTYDWSPTLAKMGGRVSYQKQRKAAILEGQSPTTLQTLKEKLSIIDTGDEDYNYVYSQLRVAWTDLYGAQKQAGHLRQTFLEELAVHKAEQQGTIAATELKKLIHIEAVRKTARKHGWYLKAKKQE